MKMLQYPFFKNFKTKRGLTSTTTYINVPVLKKNYYHLHKNVPYRLQPLALFSSKIFCKIEIVPLSFVFDKYYPIMY